MNHLKNRTGMFVSYSHKDVEWLEKLKVHLAPVLQDEKLFLWDDKKITPGTRWDEEISKALSSARIAILLVSPDYLASQYVANYELPAIIERTERDLTIFWIPIRASAWELTLLKQFQAAHDPSKPLAELSKAQQDRAFVAIANRLISAVEINALGNSFRIIDSFEPQATAFMEDREEPSAEVVHSVRAEQVETTIHLVDHGSTRKLITAGELEKLDTDSRILIRAYERAMKTLYLRWTELKERRYARDPDIRKDARTESEDVRQDLCAELNGLLGFLESMGMYLQDHYHHARHICSS